MKNKEKTIKQNINVRWVNVLQKAHAYVKKTKQMHLPL